MFMNARNCNSCKWIVQQKNWQKKKTKPINWKLCTLHLFQKSYIQPCNFTVYLYILRIYCTSLHRTYMLNTKENICLSVAHSKLDRFLRLFAWTLFVILWVSGYITSSNIQLYLKLLGKYWNSRTRARHIWTPEHLHEPFTLTLLHINLPWATTGHRF